MRRQVCLHVLQVRGGGGGSRLVEQQLLLALQARHLLAVLLHRRFQRRHVVRQGGAEGLLQPLQLTGPPATQVKDAVNFVDSNEKLRSTVRV